MSGEIPPELGSLTNVTELRLNGNQLNGIPPELGSLTNLERLLLHDNQLSGEIPGELGNLSNLKWLELQRNELSGIPPELGSLSNLEHLDLQNNQLNGEIPGELGSLSNLEWLNLGYNQLSGEIPGELGSLSNLDGLILHTNQLSGGIPGELGSLSNLRILSISGNSSLSGPLPGSFTGLTSLTSLLLSGTGLCAPTDAEFQAWVRFTWRIWGGVVDCGADQAGTITLSMMRPVVGAEVTATLSDPDGAVTGVTWQWARSLDGATGWADIAGATSMSYTPVPLDEGYHLRATAAYTDPLAAGRTALAVSDHPVTAGDPLVVQYDDNGNGTIEKNEVIESINDYLFGDADEAISKAEVIRLINLYLFGPPTTSSPPGAPEGLTASGNGLTRMDLSWSAPSSDGGAAITGYRIEVSEDGSTWTDLAANTGSAATSYSDTGLTSGTTRHYRVSAINSAGTGAASDIATGTTAMAGCVEDLGALGTTPGRVSIGRIGQNWASDCPSTNEAGSYARYYTFTLVARGKVTITLESRDANPYLYLLHGSGRGGFVEAENDDHEGSMIRSQIQETLEAGVYTIEATTFDAGQTGRFNLTVIEPATLSPQGVALMALHEATGGDNWANNESWGDAGKRLGEWYGVITDEQGLVIGLDLNDNGLTGELPPELVWSALTDLEWLDLGDNRLTGQMPAELGDLSQLLELDLGNNRLSGPIPSQLGNLASLVRLHLHGNQLSGTIPPQLGGLSNLRVVYLSDNRLAGEIPVQLGSISNLRVLSLSNNRLTGPIPAALDNLSELQWLNLEQNQLTGEIPAELGSLSSLNGLRLHNNELTGPIPAELANPPNLTDLEIHANQLSGPIPEELGGLSNLTVLRLNDNELTGPIPEELGLLLDLSALYLAGSNQLSGCIPHALVRHVPENDFDALGLASCPAPPTGPRPGDSPDGAALAALYNATGGDSWQDNDNWLSDAPLGEWDGVITDEDGRVIALLLHNNRLTGTLPPELGNLADLRWLSLGGNRLTRAIPEELGNLANLQWLSLERNRLSGAIPDALGDLPSLEALHIRDNRLDGEIPSGLGRLANLAVLDLGRNRLTGEIPAGLGRLANLRILYLDDQDYFRGKQGHPGGWDPTYLLDESNYLHGEIPAANWAASPTWKRCTSSATD